MTWQVADRGGRIGRRVIAVGLICCLIPGAASALTDEVIERVLATVAGQVIMASDVRAARELGLVSVESESDPTRGALSHLIDRALVLTEVDRYAPPEPDEEAITRALQAVRSRFPAAERFEAALRRVGLNEPHLRERLRQDLRISAYLDQRFAAPASDGQVEAPAAERRATRVEEWIAGLRRRTPIVTLY
jgi:hypothetical protein